MNRELTEFLKIPEAVRIPYFGGKLYNFLTKVDNKIILKEKIPEKPLNTEKREEKIIVSLTSFPARINYVYLAIKSLMLQSYKPDRIILWLAEEQFADKKLPENLVALEKFGLEIYWIEHNLYGHKKYFFPIMQQKENELVITYDDDLIYAPNSIEKLINTHKKYPGCIVCNRTQTLKYDENGNVVNPGRWDTISNIGLKKPSFKLAPSTGGGCLYPYGAISTDLLNVNDIKQIALRGDDMWIMFVATQCETPIIKTCKYHKTFSVIANSQEQQLSTGNIINNEYEDTLNKLIEKFPEAWERTITDTK